MPDIMKCNHCHSKRIVKNGHMYRFCGGKKYRQLRYLCKNCGRSTMGKRVPVGRG